MLAGSAAGVVSTLFTYPLDLVRARMAIEHISEGGIMTACKRYIARDGWRGLYAAFFSRTNF